MPLYIVGTCMNYQLDLPPKWNYNVRDNIDRFTAGAFGKKILEIGPGAGWSSLPLAHISKTYCAVEANQTLCQVLEKNFHTYNIPLHLFCCNFQDFQTKEKFDLVVMVNVFHLFPDPISILHKCQALLRHNHGCLFIQEPLPEPRRWGLNSLNQDDPAFDEAAWNRKKHALGKAHNFLDTSGFFRHDTDRSIVFVKETSHVE